jgi:hypothetical protein
MPKKNIEIKNREDFMLQGTLSEVPWEPKSEEQIQKDLFKSSDPDKILDAFETQLGIKSNNVPIPNEIYKCIFLKPCSDDEHAQLLQDLYNNSRRYRVLNRSDNWTHKGDLVMFVEYVENLDVKAELEKEKENNI